VVRQTVKAERKRLDFPLFDGAASARVPDMFHLRCSFHYPLDRHDRNSPPGQGRLLCSRADR
jgi:hypothetical protein